MMQAVKQFLGQFQFMRELDLLIRGPKWRPGEQDFSEIEDLRLPVNERFKSVADAAERIEGMLSPFSMAALDMLLSLQRELGAKGDVLEIGTYRGKSAALLGTHLRPSERLTLVDIADYLDPASVAPFKAQTDFVLAPSSRLKSALPNYSARCGTFRLIHIDASHGYEETFQELEMADELLAPLGIIAMDDFTNLNYSQNIAAIFKYLYTTSTKLMLFLVTDEKGYLCRKKDFNTFAELILRRSIAEMKSRDVSATLARTSYGPEYRAFYLRERGEDETALYGPETYKNQIFGL